MGWGQEMCGSRDGAAELSAESPASPSTGRRTQEEVNPGKRAIPGAAG